MRSSAERKRPWSPLSVSIVALLFPPGGAVLTIRNLVRLEEIDQRRAGQLTAVTIAIFALGLTVLLVLGQPKGGQPTELDSGVTTVLSVGTAIASYMALQRPYRAYRMQHTAPNSSWISALGWGLVYTLLTSGAVVLLRGLLALIAFALGWSPGKL